MSHVFLCALSLEDGASVGVFAKVEIPTFAKSQIVFGIYIKVHTDID